MDEIQKQFENDLQASSTSKDLEALKVKYLGKKGVIAAQMARLREVAPDQKREFGKQINDIKILIEAAISRAEDYFNEKEESAKQAQEILDITLPGRRQYMGSKHPVSQVMDDMVDIFVGMGFSIVTSPEIETDYYNFEVLNFEPDHPARDMQDSFYIEPGVLLRTHATTFQGHVLEVSKPPLRLICPGRCFRNETISSRSHVFFHQIDGLYVAENVSFQDLIATMQEFVHKFFGPTVAVRFRPSYFPFVEPGTEVDIGCVLCRGSGCSLCKYTGWLEILGAGMIHPQVLKNCGLDPEKYTGFAWGMGVERSAMLKLGINDIRLFAENDLRFLRQFVAV